MGDTELNRTNVAPLDRNLEYPAYPVEEYEPDYGKAGLIDAAMIRGILFRQRIILGATIVAVLLAGIVYTLLQVPLYQASATVRVDLQGGNIVEGQDLAPTISTNEVYRQMETMAGVIESRSMALEVVDSLNLAKRDDLLGDLDDVRPDDLSDEQWLSKRREMAASILRSNVSVEVPFDSRILTITYTGQEPNMTTAIVNSYAENFVMEDTRRSVETNTYARQFVQEQIETVRAKLQDAELAANAYAKRSGIVDQPTPIYGYDGSVGSSPTISSTNLTNVNAKYAEARAKRIALEQRWKSLAGIPSSQLPEVQQSSVVQGLSSQRATASAELADLRERYDDQYPQVRELSAKIATLDQQIAKAAADIKKSIQNEYLVARRQEQALSSEVANVSANTLAEQDRRVQFNILDREASALREQLAALLSRYNELSTAADIKAGSITLLDYAIAPNEPFSPNLFKNMLVALVAGIGLALGLAIIREAFDDRLRTTDEVERKLGLPALGRTPFIASDDLLKDASEPAGILAEAYSSIRSSLDFALASTEKVILFTSSQAGEGKTTTSIAVARQYAQLGRRTLLVECDLRRPSIAVQLGLKRPSAGLPELLLGEAQLHDVILQPVEDNLDVIGVGSRPDKPVEILSSKRLHEFIEKVRHEYDRIILDSSPVLGIADAPLLSRVSDVVVFVLEANGINRGQARTALRRLSGANADIAGVILTKYRALQAGEGYGYQYQYYTYGKGESSG